MITPETARRLAEAAYELGWSDACSDYQRQALNPDRPIGAGKTPLAALLESLDPHNLLGVRRDGA